MEEFKTQEIKTALKALLKKQGVTYEAIAEEIDCSVPTVKRILGKEELTLNRLLQLCEMANTNLAELEQLTKETQIKEERYSEEQEIFLAKNQNFFSYLMKLFSGESPKQIAENFKLSQRSTDKYLIGLEKMELIRVTGKQRIKPAFKQSPALGNGPLAKNYFAYFIKSAAHFFTNVIQDALAMPKGQKSEAPAQAVIQMIKISKPTYDAWLVEQEKSLQNLQTLSNFEEKTKDVSELQTAVILRANAYVKNNHPGLKNLENATGDIPNI
jgi:transcriptional regulator with XRE-family HTH domain